MLKYTVLLVVCVVTAHAQVFSAGPCPNIPVMQDFDVTKYLGYWYEQARYFAFFELNAKCVTANYTAKDNGAVRVENTDVDQLTHQVKNIVGEATLAGKPGEGKLKVQFDSIGTLLKANYFIVKTDYTRFSVVWSCESVLGLFNVEFAWILTRDKHPSADVMKEVQGVLENSHINTSKFHNTTQDCDN